MALFSLSLVFVSIAIPLCSSTIILTIFSDFDKPDDKEFFKTSLPALVDKIGEDLRVNYNFLDSARQSGLRRCVLEQIRKNVYLQASYLKCEADGKTNDECKKSLPLNQRILDACILNKVQRYVVQTKRDFKRSGFENHKTPVVLLPGKNIVENIKPENILKSICNFIRGKKPNECQAAQNPTTEDSNVTTASSSVTSNQVTTEKNIESDSSVSSTVTATEVTTAPATTN